MEARELASVEALRVIAAAWSFTDLEPAHTSTVADEIGRLVEVQVPSLTASRRTLRVLYDVAVDGPPALQSEWTAFAYPFEGPGYERPDEETDLWVTGVDASPQQCGQWARAWFERQLRRPIRRIEWDRPASGLSNLDPRVNWQAGVCEVDARRSSAAARRTRRPQVVVAAAPAALTRGVGASEPLTAGLELRSMVGLRDTGIPLG